MELVISSCSQPVASMRTQHRIKPFLSTMGKSIDLFIPIPRKSLLRLHFDILCGVKLQTFFAEKVWNSFAGMLYDTPRPEVNISEWSRLDEWRILEENACRYGHPGRARPFEFRDSNVRDPCYL